MKDFKFHIQSPVYFGHGTVKKQADLIASYGKRAFLVTTKFPAGVVNQALEDVIAVLNDKGIEYQVFDETEENPSVECCTKIATLAAAFQPDFFVGIGGGSSMDAAKCSSLLLQNNVTEVEAAYDLLFKNPPRDKWRRPYKCRPVICVPTTAGSSSEITGFYVISRKDTNSKDTPPVIIFAEAALLDPAYIKTAPQFVLDTGAMDALSHGIETSLNVNSNFMNRQVAMIGFGLFKKFKDHLLSGELTDEDFDNIMMHSSIMGMAFYQAGTLLPHGLSYYLSHDKGLNHGLACSVTQGEFLRSIPDQSLVTPILEACGFADIDECCEYFRKITNRNIHITVTEEECDEWAAHFMKYQSHRLDRFPGHMDEAGLAGIFKRSLKAYIK